jgi:hypothetical protein
MTPSFPKNPRHAVKTAFQGVSIGFGAAIVGGLSKNGVDFNKKLEHKANK